MTLAPEERRDGMAPDRLPHHWNTRPEDDEGDWPCDDLAGPDASVLLRAVDVGAPPTTVYRWLCQLRAAPYSYDWIDNGGRRSPPSLTPGLEQLALGQTVMTMFRLVAFERDDHLTLEAGRFLGLGPLHVSYRVRERPTGTRLAARLRVAHPSGLLGRAMHLALGWGDLVMMRKQLLTLKELAEQTAVAATTPSQARRP
jgi:hypothetical protein